jgi:hypothetical protein
MQGGAWIVISPVALAILVLWIVSHLAEGKRDSRRRKNWFQSYADSSDDSVAGDGDDFFRAAAQSGNHHFRMKLRFSIRVLLASTFVCAVGLALVVTPRIKRQRVIERLENDPSVGWLTTENQSLGDRLLGVDGPIDDLWLRPRGLSDYEKEVLTKEAFELVWQASPMGVLDVSDAHVERCQNYPAAEVIRISNVSGEEADD